MIYLDHHAATPIAPVAAAAMDEARAAAFANPSSPHAAGRAARQLLERARSQVATAIGAAPADVVLTSGGSEACSLALFGLPALSGKHAITTAVEHPAVARPIERLETHAKLRVTRLEVPGGRPPDADALERALRPDTGLCAVQWINHETGTRFPIEDYARVCRAAHVLLFVDATQACGKVPIEVGALPIDLLAIASHKLGGPAGAGALWVRRGLELTPLIAGGGQERGRRAGTPDVLHAVGFGAACTELGARISAQSRLGSMRDRTSAALAALGAVINGESGPRAESVVNASFDGRRGDELVAALDLEGVCVSSGAACSSGLAEPSPVLRAMYPAEAWRASAALRLSFGPETTETEVETALQALARVLARRAA